MSGTLSLTFNVTGSASVTLPLIGTGVEATIVWGDGNTDTGMVAPFTHPYANGTWTATITITAGSVTAFGANGWQGVSILTAVSTSNNATWGLPGVESFAEAFRGAGQLISVPTNIPVSVKNMSAMFDMYPITSVFNQDISGWDVSNVEDMSYMFQGANAFNQDISSWNVSSVRYMQEMFANNSGFNNGAVGNVGGKPLTWTTGTGTSLVRNMRNMFYNADAFNQDVSSWNVSSVTEMNYMFFGTALFNNGSTTNDGLHPLTWTSTSVVEGMSNMFDGASVFNQDISSWNVSRVTNMGSMFHNTFAFNNGSTTNDGGKPLTWTAGTGTSLVTNMSGMFNIAAAFNQDISSWNVSSVTNMYNMFLGTTLFNNGAVGNVGGKPLTWTTGTGTSNVTNMEYMFGNCLAFNQDISSWNVSSVTNMSHMFEANSAFNNGATTNVGGKPLTWTAGTGTSNVTNMGQMFYYATAFNQDISSWNVSSVTNMQFMFRNASLFNQNIGSLNVSNVTDMSYMFFGARVFNNGSITNDGLNPLTWSAGTGTSNVVYMNRMFDQSPFNQTISGWNMSKVTDISGMFANTPFNNGSITNDGLHPLTWTEGTGTSNVTNMNAMFDTNSAFNQTITSWNVSSVTNMSQLFFGLYLFNNGAVGDVGGKPLTSWDVSKVTDMTFMFGNAQVFNQDISSWNVSNVTSMYTMFFGCIRFNQDITLWNVSKVTTMWAMFYNARTFNQDISSWDVSKVINMPGMFNNAIAFNKNIRSWVIQASVNLNNMFDGATAFQTAFYPTTPGYDVASGGPNTPLYTFFIGPPPPLSLTFNVTTGSTIVTLPIVEDPLDPITFTINWGDGTIDSSLNHMYATIDASASFVAGVTITAGSVTRFGASGWQGVDRLTAVATSDTDTWGLPGVTSFEYAFYGATLLTSVPAQVPSSVKDMTRMFSFTSLFNQAIGGWNVSNVTNMNNMFSSTTGFNQDISSWNVSSVTNMVGMFQDSSSFNNGAVGNVGGKPLPWTSTSVVTNMSDMFARAPAFNQDISSWNVSSVTTMSDMFQSASLFNNGAVGNVGGKPLTWSAGTGTSNVLNMSNLFSTALAFNQYIGGWNVSSVTNMNGMFANCKLFNQNIGGWDVSSVTNMGYMFFNNTDTRVFNQDISSWDVSSVTNLSGMFYGARAFNNGDTGNNGLKALTWGNKTSNVTDMGNMFHTATAFNQTITSWNVSSVQNMNQMFNNALIFNNGSTTNNASNELTWGANTSNVTDMSAMFYNDFGSAFNQKITGWDVSKVTNMQNMFYGAAVFNNGSTTNDGLNALTWGAKTSNVTNMVQVFRGASAFNQDISGWDVSKVTDIQYMFLQASAFNNGDTGNNGLKALTWGTKTSNITNMASVFSGANSFNQDISSWDVSKVTTMTSMFRNSTIFNYNIRIWDVDSVTDFVDMFIGATAFQTAFYPTTPGYDVASGGPDTPTAVFFIGPPPTLSLTFNVTTSPFIVTLPIIGTDVSANIVWGDDTTDTDMAAPFTHVYARDGSFTAIVTITSPSGSVTQFGSFNWPGVGILTAVATSDNDTWGLPGVTSFNQAFNGAILLQSVPSGIPSTVTNMSYMFAGAEVFDQDISTWDVSYVTNMYAMFIDAYIFNNGGAALTWSAGTGTSNVTNMGGMFQGARLFDQDIGGWNVSRVTNMGGMFSRAAVFNNGGAALTWTAGTGTSNVTDMTYMFADAYIFNADISGWNVGSVTDMSWMFKGTGAFNQNISTWNVSNVTNMFVMFFGASAFNNGGVALTWSAGTGTSNVTNMSTMFKGASAFNADISSWDVSSVTDMSNMFENAVLFNKNIRYWVVVSPTTLTNMFLGATAMTAKYTGTTGYGATPLYTFFNQVPYPCFLEDTQILCLENGKEVYRPVQSLRKGDLVKTIYNGYLPIHMIGTSPMYNPNNNDRIAARLYKCPKENYPGLLDDLYITGCHSILVPWLTYEQGQKTIASLGRLFVTDKHCRLMAWVDEKAVPYKMEGVYNIYHIALENEDYYMNYGIYANGLLVESCSKRYLMEMSNMRILGEEDCSLTEGVSAEENVFHKMPALIETC